MQKPASVMSRMILVRLREWRGGSGVEGRRWPFRGSERGSSGRKAGKPSEAERGPATTLHPTARPMGVPVLTIARYTIKGYVKERVLLVVLVFALLLMVSSYVLSPLAVGAQQKIIVDIGLASISVFGVLLVILIAASSYTREREKGILPNILSKPIGRVDFILGKFLGTWVTVLLVMTCMAVVYFCVMLVSRTPFNSVIFVALLLAALEIAVVTAVMTFFSTFTSPLLSALFTSCVVVTGHLSGDLLEFARHFGGIGFQIASSIGYYVLPNLALFNVRSEAVHGLPLMDWYVYSVAVYGAFYTLFSLFLSSLIFRRRDVVA